MTRITIDGVDYATLADAAAAIGLEREQLRDRLRNGSRHPPYTAVDLVEDRRQQDKNTARRARLRAWLQRKDRPTLADFARSEGISKTRVAEIAKEPEFAALRTRRTHKRRRA